MEITNSNAGDIASPGRPERNFGVKLPIYMDNHATTPLDPRVLKAMLPYFSEQFGNPASRNHVFGWAAEVAVEKAREQVARLIGATAKEIIFTSGATESDNLAIKGLAEMKKSRGDHIITAATEHKAVLDTCRRLQQSGYRITCLPVRQDGTVNLENLLAAIDDKTILVSIMAANNEIGTLQPITEIGEICLRHGVTFHTDAAQAVGKIPLDVSQQNIGLMSISGHKMYGPKGIGALFIRENVREKGRENVREKGRDNAADRDAASQISPMIDGGGHERGLRSGTLNVPGIVGLGEACAIALEEMSAESCRMAGLRNRLKDSITRRLPDVYVNGSMEHRLPGNLSIGFAGVDGESLMMGLDDIAVSSSSACSSATMEPSHVLKALHVENEVAHSSIRFGIGRFNTEAEVDYVAHRVVETVQRLREVAAL